VLVNLWAGQNSPVADTNFEFALIRASEWRVREFISPAPAAIDSTTLHRNERARRLANSTLHW